MKAIFSALLHDSCPSDTLSLSTCLVLGNLSACYTAFTEVKVITECPVFMSTELVSLFMTCLLQVYCHIRQHMITLFRYRKVIDFIMGLVFFHARHSAGSTHRTQDGLGNFFCEGGYETVGVCFI